ncbi:MAG: ribosomal protein S18-alanine N-acetyltransferase [Endomicrobium sp.]|jgi:ribosomal-protein-alanine N-acetyltransferase|nr:ribosomal protein S18-alanine N-acetyltransferase [Endomicrobium sp.]
MEIVDFSAFYLEDIIEIEKKSFPRPWTQDMFLHSAANEVIYFKTAVKNAKAIGYCIFWVVGGETEILNIAVDPDLRGKSYGRQMLECVYEISKNNGSKSIFLEVRQSNAAALSLYGSFGFESIGVRKKYYIDEDAIVMRKGI